MPAVIEQSIHDIYSGQEEQLQDRFLIEPGNFMPIEFYSPQHELLAAYVIAVTEEDLGSKVIQWTTRTSRESYPEIDGAMSVKELQKASKEEVVELEYGGTPKTIVMPRLARTEPISMFTVMHKPIADADAAILL